MASTWRRAAAGMLLDRPYLDASICGTEQEYIDARGGSGWTWQADVTFDSMRAAMLQHLAADGFRWSKPGLLRVAVGWLMLLLATFAAMVAILMPADHEHPDSLVPAARIGLVFSAALVMGLRFGASIRALQLLRNATVQHMVACAWLREHASRLAQPLAAGQEQQALQMHAIIAYLQELQRLQRRATIVRAMFTPFAPAFPLPPPQTLRRACGKSSADPALRSDSCGRVASEAGESLLAADVSVRVQSAGGMGSISALTQFVPSARRLWQITPVCKEATELAAETYGLGSTLAQAAAAGAERQIRCAAPPPVRERSGFWAGLAVPIVLCMMILHPSAQKHGISWGLLPVLILLLGRWGTYVAVFAVQRRILGRACEARQRVDVGDEEEGAVTAATDCVLASCRMFRGFLLPASTLEGPQLLWSLGGGQV